MHAFRISTTMLVTVCFVGVSMHELAAQQASPSPEVENAEVAAFRELGGQRIATGFKSSWSPDGKRLVFGRQEGTYAEQGQGLTILNLESGEATNLVAPGKDPAWSPGAGKYIVYARNYGATEQVWIVESTGENPRKLAEGGYPSWSPDGKTVYYQSRSQRKILAVGIDRAEQEPQEVLTSNWWYPALSADGKQVAYRQGDRVIIADCQTGQTRKEYVVPDARGFLGNWSPNGKHIAYGGYGFHDKPGLWILEVETGKLKQLSQGHFTMPAWSADGSRLSLDLRLRSGFEVWMIDAKVIESLEPFKMPRDRYTVPEDGVDQILAFIQDLRKFRLRSAPEYQEHRAKSSTALKLAAERILQLEQDKSSEAVTTATLVLLEGRVREIATAEREEQKEIISTISDALTKKARTGLESIDLRLAMNAAQSLERSNQTELAANAYEQFAAVARASGGKDLANTAGMFEGCSRRLRLPGNTLEITGKTIDGKEFDWAEYRGKVVLVDFWATWCGPCRAELPNVKKYYELYHDDGFEVVGISLDRTRQALESFLEKENLPWVTLYDEEASGTHPLATYYGVLGIPTVLLVDKEGKVVSLRARGDELGRCLEQLLGPPDEEKLRKIEERMKAKAARPLAPAVKQRGFPAAVAGKLGPDEMFYLACGSSGGPGKVYQVDPRGRVVATVALPSAPYGIDLCEDGLVVAMPRAGVSVIAHDGSLTAIPCDPVTTPLDIAVCPKTGSLLVADNRTDVLAILSPNENKPAKIVQRFDGSQQRGQNLSVAVTSDGHHLLATNEPKGIYRFPTDAVGPLGRPIIELDGDVAADRSSNRWAAVTTDGEVRVFQTEKPVASMSLPDPLRVWRSGILAFGPSGTLVTAIDYENGPVSLMVDLEAKKFRPFFQWRQERLVDIAIGPAMDWPRVATSTEASNDKGDKLEFRAFEPPLPHVFEAGERLTVQFDYTLQSADSCQLFVRPFTDGQRTPGYGAHGSARHPRGKGSSTGWFGFSGPAQVDHVRIEMVTNDEVGRRTLQLFVEADAEWRQSREVVASARR